MPGENCCVVGCGTSRRSKGIGIFKLPAPHINKEWRERWLGEITKTRYIDNMFNEQIQKDHVYTCEKHFHKEDIEIFPGKKYIRKKLRPGALPLLNNSGISENETKRHNRKHRKQSMYSISSSLDFYNRHVCKTNNPVPQEIEQKTENENCVAKDGCYSLVCVDVDVSNKPDSDNSWRQSTTVTNSTSRKSNSPYYLGDKYYPADKLNKKWRPDAFKEDDVNVLKNTSRVSNGKVEANVSDNHFDQDYLFGKMIAGELKRFPDNLKFRIKHEMNNVIFKYQVEMESSYQRHYIDSSYSLSPTQVFTRPPQNSPTLVSYSNSN